jgi:hypothetical protein
MSSITAADLKLGGRLVAACDAIGQGHLRRAAGIFNEIADDLNGEAEATTGLLAEEGESTAGASPVQVNSPPSPPAHVQPPQPSTSDLQMCARNVHAYGHPDPVSGWRTCGVCGNVNVAPPGNGPIDMGARNL